VETISTMVDQYPPLTERVDQETKDDIHHFWQEIKAHAGEAVEERRAKTEVYSGQALKAWLEAHENLATSIGYQYHMVHEFVPVRGELQGLKLAANATEGENDAQPNRCYIDNERRIVCMIRKYKTDKKTCQSGQEQGDVLHHPG
jgi:hypothetical protein